MRFLRLPLILCLLAPVVLRAQSNLVLIVGPECYFPNAPIRTVFGTDATNVSASGNPSSFAVNGKGMIVSFAGPNGASLTVGQYSNTTASIQNGSSPHLNLQGFACNCFNLNGHFEILELHTDFGGAIDRLWVTFSVQCSLGSGLTFPGATGEVRFCSALAPPPPAPRTLRVPSEFPKIQAAIDDASYLTTDTVLVAPGTYNEAVTFRAKPVALVSEAGPEQTHIAPLSNEFAVKLDNDSDKALLSGFTLEGYGLEVDWGEPTIISNIITGTNTHSIVLSSAVIRSNQFRGAIGNGLYISGLAAPVVEGNVIEENGLGIVANSTASPLIRNNVIRNNQHGGIFAGSSCGALIIQNLIVGNRSGVSLDGFVNPSPYTPPATNAPLLLNNTIVSDVHAPGSGVTLANFNGVRPIVLNNIVVGSPALAVFGSSNAVFDLVQSNDFFSTFGSTYFLMPAPPSRELTNNISTDPLFVCLEGDYHLQPVSPCVDAGTNSAFNLPAVDLDGRPRILPGSTAAVVDMGAFEFDPALTPPIPCVTIICPRDALIHAPFGVPSVIVNYPTPYASPGATVTCSPPPGSAFPPGTNVVTCTAVSTNGTNWCSFNVIVLVEPPNDDFDHATMIPTLPYTNVLDVTGATISFDEPTNCSPLRAHTVWYQIKTKRKTDVYLSSFGSDYFVNLSVYTGTRGNLKLVVCDDSSLKFTAQPNRTYYIMAASGIGTPANRLELRASTRPSFNATVVLNSTARIDRTLGGPLLTANVRTSRQLLVTISGSLEQKKRSGQIVHSEFLNGVDCFGRAGWSAVAPGTFERGLAEVHLHITAYDTATGESVNTERSTRVTLLALPTLIRQ